MKTGQTPRLKPSEEVFSAMLIVLVLLVLPLLGATAMVIGSAAGLTAYIRLFPERFRGRSGSLKLAICLVVAMWIAAAVVSVLSLVGGR